jgi:hypothetical protein
VLRLDTDLRLAYKQLCKSVQGLRNSKASEFDYGFLEFIVRRYFLSLHLPWMRLALQEAHLAFSRRAVIEAASKLWQTISGEHEMGLLSICGAGFFRSIPVQAGLAISIEVRFQLLDEDSLGPKAPRPDLMAMICEAKDWSLRRIEAGETNIKGHLSLCALGVSLAPDPYYHFFQSALSACIRPNALSLFLLPNSALCPLEGIYIGSSSNLPPGRHRCNNSRLIGRRGISVFCQYRGRSLAEMLFNPQGLQPADNSLQLFAWCRRRVEYLE